MQRHQARAERRNYAFFFILVVDAVYPINRVREFVQQRIDCFELRRHFKLQANRLFNTGKFTIARSGRRLVVRPFFQFEIEPADTDIRGQGFDCGAASGVHLSTVATDSARTGTSPTAIATTGCV